MATRRKPTTTSEFGVSRRENHDSSDFYARFTSPDLSSDSEIKRDKDIDGIFLGDARSMPQVSDRSVALIVTSPPYFAGKEYESALGQGHVPATYLDYLRMLEEVFAECVRTLEPGGRLAVNVANLGRKPYRSLSADVIHILQDKLRLLLRGEVLWIKGRGATGSTAWGSFQRPANPVLRDLTERVIIASKGRFDRAISAKQRLEQGLPSVASLSRDEFMEATTDVWEISPESATRVGHPAPFPVELPERLIHLFTYYDDLVLDPFMGSGTTAVAAIRTGRHFAGYDTDAEYVKRARLRVAAERKRIEDRLDSGEEMFPLQLPAHKARRMEGEDFQARAVREGRAAKDIAEAVLTGCGFGQIESDVKFADGVEVSFRAYDKTGGLWFFEVSGAFTSSRPGLRRTDTLWKALGKAAVLRQLRPDVPLVLLTTHAPPERSAGDRALQVLLGQDKPIYALIEMRSVQGQERLRAFAEDGRQ